jgi:hypothetical protein
MACAESLFVGTGEKHHSFSTLAGLRLRFGLGLVSWLRDRARRETLFRLAISIVPLAW